MSNQVTIADLLNAMENKVAVSFDMITAEKKWDVWKITMFASPEIIDEMLLKENKVPILIVCDKDKFEKAKKDLL